MRKCYVFVGILGLVAVAAAVVAVPVATERAKTAAWKDAFGLRLESLEARGRPTSYADLNAARPRVEPDENGAALLAELPGDFDAIATGAPGPYYDPFPGLLSMAGPKPEVEAAAKAALQAEDGRFPKMWGVLDAASERQTIQGTYSPPSDSPDALYQGMRCVSPLLMLRAWAHPERQIEFAVQMLTLARRIECHGGYYYFLRDEILRDGLQLLRIAIERGLRPSAVEGRALHELLTGFEGQALTDFRCVPELYRVRWAHYADPSLERWSWISDYDHFGEGWKLYRDVIRAFDRMEMIASELQSEAGLRAIGARDEEVAGWNSQLPSFGYVAGEALEVLSQVRLAAIALDAVELLGPKHASQPTGPALAERLLSSVGPDALTGEAFVVHEEGPLLFLSVPWRETDFSLRPHRVRGPWHPDYGGPAPTWANDSLRGDGWMWMIRRR